MRSDRAGVVDAPVLLPAILIGIREADLEIFGFCVYYESIFQRYRWVRDGNGVGLLPRAILIFSRLEEANGVD